MQIFDTELKYQKLVKTLKNTSSVCYKLRLLSNFLLPLLKESDQNKFYSYYSDLFPELISLINKNEIRHYSPEEIEDIEYLVYSLKSAVHDTPGPEIQKSLEVLNTSKENIKNILNGEIPENEGTDIYPDFLAILLIEKNANAGIDDIIETGFIHNLHLSSSIRSKSEKIDKVEFKNLIDLNEAEIISHLNSVVENAKKYCDKNSVKTNFYNFTFYFEKQDYIYSGSSLGIGAICLAYNSILINELNKYYYKFRNDCVFSGAMAKDGILIPLDRESLRVKLKTVFFSEYRKFIIPEDNIVKAKDILSELNDKYPNRYLELIPIKNFVSVFKNLDVVERYELKFTQKVRANYKKYQSRVNWTIGIAGILIILFFLINYLIPHLDRNPVTPDFIDGKYIAYNKHNIKIWERQIDGYKANHQLDEDGKNHLLKRTITIKDIDKDKKNEILVLNNYFPEASPDGKNIVYCFNSDNNLEWEFEAKNEKVHYRDDYDGPFVFSDIFSADFNGDGYFEIIANGHINTVFPNKIYVLDYQGMEISSYWHAGYVSLFRAYNIDKDSIVEIVAAGVTNMKNYRCGCMIVFDPEFIEGNSFDTDPVGDGKKGLEKYYIIFPKTFMTIFNPSDMNDVWEIAFSENKMLVTVSDGPTFPDYNENAFLLYEFDNSLRVTNVIMSNQFQKLYEIYIKEKKIQPIEDMKSYLDSLKSEVRYWDGDKFVKNSVMNRHYLEVVNKKTK